MINNRGSLKEWLHDKSQTIKGPAPDTLKNSKQSRHKKQSKTVSLSSQEINSLFSILDSAQSYVDKASFGHPGKPENVPGGTSDIKTDDINDIKKKFYTGPKGLE